MTPSIFAVGCKRGAKYALSSVFPLILMYVSVWQHEAWRLHRVCLQGVSVKPLPPAGDLWDLHLLVSAPPHPLLPWAPCKRENSIYHMMTRSLRSPAPTSRPWPRRTSPSSSTRSSGTPGWTRSCSRACGRTRSRLWSTNTSPWLPTQTGVRPQRCHFADSLAQMLTAALWSPRRRSDLPGGSAEFPDGIRDDRRHAGQPGQVSGHEPASAALLHQVVSQHIPDR